MVFKQAYQNLTPRRAQKSRQDSSVGSAVDLEAAGHTIRYARREAGGRGDVVDAGVEEGGDWAARHGPPSPAASSSLLRRAALAVTLHYRLADTETSRRAPFMIPDTPPSTANLSDSVAVAKEPGGRRRRGVLDFVDSVPV